MSAGAEPTLLAVPNVSEGRDARLVARLAAAFASDPARLLDVHSDPDHNRSVFTLAAPAGAIGAALRAGGEATLGALDLSAHEGLHPRIGALDVCPVVYLAAAHRERARELALEAADELASLGVPVFLYGELASAPERRERSHFRRGGPAELARRMRSGELRPDRGPAEPHPTAGATLVTARPPLAAFNLELDPGDAEAARAIAAELREGGGGLPGVRAIGLELGGGRVQVSTNVHDPAAVTLAQVVERVRALALAHGARVARAEVVGLVPQAALAGFPADVPIPGFDPARQVIERALEP